MIECKDCKYNNNCPAGWSYGNAACLTIQQRDFRSLGEAGQIAEEVSDLILFHRRVRENAEKRYI